MVIKRQKEFGKIAGLKNKVKAIPRHLKKRIDIQKAYHKMGKYGDLSPEEVKNALIPLRSMKIPGTKLNKELMEQSPADAKELRRAAKRLQRIHKAGRGAEYDWVVGKYAPTEKYRPNYAEYLNESGKLVRRKK